MKDESRSSRFQHNGIGLLSWIGLLGWLGLLSWLGLLGLAVGVRIELSVRWITGKICENMFRFVFLFFVCLSDTTEETPYFWYIVEGNQEIFFYRICEADPLTAFGLGIWTNLVFKHLVSYFLV